MPKLPQITAKELAKVAQKCGFALDRTKGSHFIYFRPKDCRSISIPQHHGKTLGKGLVYALIKQMDLTLEQFLDLLKQR